MPKDDICYHLDFLHSVLGVPKYLDKPVRILHLSFRDFLLNTDSRFRVDETDTEEDSQQMSFYYAWEPQKEHLQLAKLRNQP